MDKVQKKKFSSVVIYVQPLEYRSRFAPFKTIFIMSWLERSVGNNWCI